jgi:IS605 OrfB family transposase
LADYDLGTGSFSEDARGRWYLNVKVKVQARPICRVPLASGAIGIDLGQKTLMTDSDGSEVQAERFYRQTELRLATAQRAGKKDRVRSLHASIKNQRKDQHHKLTSQQVSAQCAIFVGNVNSSGLAKAGQGKSVLDAGWSSYRTMLKYKCHKAGVWFREINESYTTQECHVCHVRTGPKGQADLGVRDWVCLDCGVAHGRDHNAAINIRERGLKWLELQISAASGQAYAPALVVNKAFDSIRKSKAAVGYGRLAGGIPVLSA